MRRLLLCLIATAALFASQPALKAQGLLDRTIALERRLFNDTASGRVHSLAQQLLNISTVTKRERDLNPAAAQETPPHWSISPFAHTTEGAVSAGFHLSNFGNFSPNAPYNLKIGYASVHMNGVVPNRDKYGYEGTFGLPITDKRWTFTIDALGFHTATGAVSNSYNVSLATDYAFSHQWTVSTALGWGRAETNTAGTDAFVPDISLTWTANKYVDVGLDYTVKNAVDGEDDWSLNCVIAIPKLAKGGALFLSVGKHSTLLGKLSVKF